MLKRIHIKMNRVYTWKESDLSETRKKFLNFHQHHEYCKFLKKDFLPKEKERSILIIADKFGKVHKETIELIPFNNILIVDPFFEKYNCSIIDGKCVMEIPLEPIIFLQIAQGMGIKIDSLFLSNVDDTLFDFLLEMCYPLMKENEFTLIQQHPSPFEDKIKTFPFEVVHKIEQSEYEQFDMFCLMCKTKESKSFKIKGKTAIIIHGTFWDHIDTSLQAVFSTFINELSEWEEYLIRLYQTDIYDLNGVYTSEDEKVYDLKKMENLYALINQCEFRIIGITLNPRIYEHLFHILMSENHVEEIYIFGFLDSSDAF